MSEIQPNVTGGPSSTQGQYGYTDPSTSASVSTAKAQVGMSLDTLKTMFTEQQKAQGDAGIVNSNPNRPILPSVSQSITNSSNQDASNQLLSTVMSMVEQLPDNAPDNLQTNLLTGLGTGNIQDPDLQALYSALMTSATVINPITNFSNVATTDSSSQSVAYTSSDSMATSSDSTTASSTTTSSAASSNNSATATTSSDASATVNSTAGTAVTNSTSATAASNVASQAVLAGVAAQLDQGEQTIDALENEVSSMTPSQLSAAGMTTEDQVNMLDFLKAVGTALTKARQLIAELQSQDSKNSKTLTTVQIDAGNDNIKTAIKNYENLIEQEEKAAKMKKLMGILGPLITVVMAVITIATLGSASPMAIAVAVAVTAASVAISVADSQTGFMSNGIQSLMSKMKSAMPDWAADLVMVVMVVVLVAVCKGAGAKAGAAVGESAGEAATNAAAEETAESGVSQINVALIKTDSKAAVVGTVNQFAVAQSSSIMMNSNVIQSAVLAIMKAIKGSTSDDDSMIASIIQTVIIAAVAILALYKGGGGGSGKATANLGLSGSASGVATGVNVTAGLAQGGLGIAQGATNIQISDLQKIAAGYQQIITSITLTSQANKKESTQLTNEIQSASEDFSGLSDLWNTLIQTDSNTVSQITSA